MYYPQHSALLNNGLGLFSIVGFPWLDHIPSLADFAMETKVCTFKVDTNTFTLLMFWLITGPDGYEDLLFNRYVEILNMC
jgi:hypothetical protein